mmetsp:Transcript_84694/g.149997  ORF Transcript_84694/g.149997 Transcript_84694/m.149997 type:complete len:244 (-) Transcript_84694:35-766(-)
MVQCLEKLQYAIKRHIPNKIGPNTWIGFKYAHLSITSHFVIEINDSTVVSQECCHDLAVLIRSFCYVFSKLAHPRPYKGVALVLVLHSHIIKQRSIVHQERRRILVLAQNEFLKDPERSESSRNGGADIIAAVHNLGPNAVSPISWLQNARVCGIIGILPILGQVSRQTKRLTEYSQSLFVVQARHQVTITRQNFPAGCLQSFLVFRNRHGRFIRARQQPTGMLLWNLRQLLFRNSPPWCSPH